MVRLINKTHTPKDTGEGMHTGSQPKQKRRESLPGRANVDTTTLAVVCVNINGLRKKKKLVLLGKLMFDLWAGVCVVTETHLRKRARQGSNCQLPHPGRRLPPHPPWRPHRGGSHHSRPQHPGCGPRGRHPKPSPPGGTLCHHPPPI